MAAFASSTRTTAQNSAEAAGDLYKKAVPSVVVIELYNDNGEADAARHWRYEPAAAESTETVEFHLHPLQQDALRSRIS